MFDVGFSELLVIAVVALLVLGPERLPKAARFAGLWVRRARAQWNSVKAEFEHDLADEDLKRSLRETQDALRDAHASLRNAGSGLEREMHEARESVMRGPQPPAAGAAGAAGAAIATTPVLVEHAPAGVAPSSEQPLSAAEEAEREREEQTMHAPMEDPPPPDDADIDDEVPQR
ncbi:Sec-independent protein translocase protein TatB [Cognatiluteimonas profundi]|uniref:Sec-independent protein translocase protein TatB n=1 Tax=Cognatiluteimonas profundi TaxID=2594501 RepID=UPI00131BD965|nr:Sec-independent protein translocase protein TatB [Lysobacter profundi]